MKLKGILLVALFVTGGLSLSSCNRGYGCPTWSAKPAIHAATQVVVGLAQLP